MNCYNIRVFNQKSRRNNWEGIGLHLFFTLLHLQNNFKICVKKITKNILIPSIFGMK